jgi:hypothetical protein
LRRAFAFPPLTGVAFAPLAAGLRGCVAASVDAVWRRLCGWAGVAAIVELAKAKSANALEIVLSTSFIVERTMALPDIQVFH